MVSDAQKKATAKYERENYFKTLVRFPADKQDMIRAAARVRDPGKGSLNGYIVAAVMEKLERDGAID